MGLVSSSRTNHHVKNLRRRADDVYRSQVRNGNKVILLQTQQSFWSYLSPETWSSFSLVNGRIHSTNRIYGKRTKTLLRTKQERIFNVFSPEAPTDMDAAFLWFCFSAQVCEKHILTSSFCEEQIYTSAPLQSRLWNEDGQCTCRKFQEAIV